MFCWLTLHNCLYLCSSSSSSSSLTSHTLIDSSNCLFKGLPRRLHPFRLQFHIISSNLLLLILVTCRSQLDLYFLSFSSRICLFLCGQSVYLAVLPRNFLSVDVNSLFFAYVYCRQESTWQAFKVEIQ